MTNFKLFRSLGMLTACASLLFAVGCDAPSDEPIADGEQGVTASPETADPGAAAQPNDKFSKRDKFGRRGHHDKFGKGGAPGLLGAALHKLTLSDAQKTKIEGLIADVRGDQGAPDEEHQAFREAMAQGVEAGKIDPAIVQTQVTAMDAKMSAHRGKMATALNELHATLTPAQRSELTTDMRAKMEAHKGRFDKGSAAPMLDDGDDDADAPDMARPAGKRGMRGMAGKRGMRGMHGMHGGAGGKLGRLLRQLDLSEDQQSQLREARKANMPARPEPEAMKAKWQERQAKMTAMLDAFASDSFDANKFDMAEGKGDMMRQALDGEVSAFNAALPILSAEQRTELAKLLRQAPKRGAGKRGMRGMRGAGRRAAPSAD